MKNHAQKQFHGHRHAVHMAHRLTLGEGEFSALNAARGRILFVGIIFAIGFMLIMARAVEVALWAPPQRHAALGHRKTKPKRADIVDRNGELLASTLTTYSLYADPRDVWDARATALALKKLFPELRPDKLQKKLESRKSFVWVKRNLTPRQRQSVFDLGLAGLDFRPEPRRVYPRGRLGSHVLGWTDTDMKGAAGVERGFESVLSSESTTPLALSVDMRVQFALDEVLRKAYRHFQAKAAAGIVMDVKTGEVLGLISLPDFDPNRAGKALPEEYLNRATMALYEMGSTFKIYTTALALESGVASLSEKFDVIRPMKVGGMSIRDYHPATHPMTISDILVQSSNKGSAQLALKSGIEAQKDFLNRLGLFERAPLKIAETAAPLLPKRWSMLTSATVSYGHGLSVSLIAHAAAMAACVNGGEYVEPTLIRRSPGSVIPRRRVMSAANSALLVRMMRQVVEEGTGRRAEVAGYGIAGKTGSAEKIGPSGYDDHRLISSFSAVFPYDNPRYAVMVLLDEPKGLPETYNRTTAGWNAAPTTGEIIARIGPILEVERRMEEQTPPESVISASLQKKGEP